LAVVCEEGCCSAPARRLIVVPGATSLASLVGWHETTESWGWVFLRHVQVVETIIEREPERRTELFAEA